MGGDAAGVDHGGRARDVEMLRQERKDGVAEEDVGVAGVELGQGGHEIRAQRLELLRAAVREAAAHEIHSLVDDDAVLHPVDGCGVHLRGMAGDEADAVSRKGLDGVARALQRLLDEV